MIHYPDNCLGTNLITTNTPSERINNYFDISKRKMLSPWQIEINDPDITMRGCSAKICVALDDYSCAGRQREARLICLSCHVGANERRESRQNDVSCSLAESLRGKDARFMTVAALREFPGSIEQAVVGGRTRPQWPRQQYLVFPIQRERPC